MESIKKQYKRNDIDDLKGKLKYLFWINIDKLVEDIKKEPKYQTFKNQYQNNTCVPENLFDLIFDKIFTYCDDYTKFLNITIENIFTFFDHQQLHPLSSTTKQESNWNYNNNIFALFKEALKNHLIIHSFLSSTNNHYTNTFFLSRNDEEDLRRGLGQQIFPVTYGQDSNNLFCRRKKRYKKDTLNALYSHKILNSLCTTNDNRFEVDYCYKTWAYYCYTAKPILNLDNSMLSQSNLINNFFKHYRTLHNHALFSSDQTNLDKKIGFNYAPDIIGSDKILFRYPAEWYYGLTSSGYIFQILNKCHNLTTFHIDSSSTLESLYGSSFLDILQKVYSLPNVFSRHFFLKYACIATLQSKSPKCEYLEPSHRPMNIIDKETNDISTPGNLIPRIDNFITMLKELTIPILEACWDTVIYELNDEFRSHEPQKQFQQHIISHNLFKQYMDDHYDELTFDYTSIPDKTLTDETTFSSIKTYIKNHKKNSDIVSSINTSGIFDSDFVITSNNKYACHDLLKILMKYFYSPNTDASPESDLLNIQIPDKPVLFSPKNDALRDFLFRNFRNVFTYYVQEFNTRTK